MLRINYLRVSSLRKSRMSTFSVSATGLMDLGNLPESNRSVTPVDGLQRIQRGGRTYPSADGCVRQVVDGFQRIGSSSAFLVGASDKSRAAGGELNVRDVVGQGERLAQIHFVAILDIILEQNLDQPIRNRSAPYGNVFNGDLALPIRCLELAFGADALFPLEDRREDRRGPVFGRRLALIELVEIHLGRTRDMVRSNAQFRILDARRQ